VIFIGLKSSCSVRRIVVRLRSSCSAIGWIIGGRGWIDTDGYGWIDTGGRGWINTGGIRGEAVAVKVVMEIVAETVVAVI
jgi:hypothetical protein